MSEHENIIQLFTATPATLLSIFFVIYLFYPEKIEKWAILFSKLASGISKKHKRRSVSLDIQSRVNNYIRNNKSNKIFKSGLKIVWIEKGKDNAYLENDEVVVIMKHHANNAENFLNAIIQYTSMALLPEVRNTIPHKIITAAELVMQEKIITEQRPDALSKFRNDIVPNEVSNNVEIKQLIAKMKKVSSAGWFDKIYLNELEYVGAKLNDLDEEGKNRSLNAVLNFLENLVNRPQGIDYPLYYKDEVFDFSIILVARPKKVLDVQPYITAANMAAKSKRYSVYVSGSIFFTPFTNKIIAEIKNRKIGDLKWNINYHGKYGERRESIELQLALFRNLRIQPDNKKSYV